MKKLIALVLAFAMLVTVFSFSASAAAAPELVLEGAATAAVGEDYTVAIRLNDADNTVGGIQGELAYTGAKVKTVEVNPDVLAYNNTTDVSTVAKDDGDSVNFAAVANLKGENYDTRIWVIVTFEITGNANFSLANVMFSNKSAVEITGNTGAALAPKAPAAGVVLKGFTMVNETKAVDQAIVVTADVSATNVKEFGVVFYPTQLLKGEKLTVDTEGAIKAYLSATDAAFKENLDREYFDATLNVNFKDELTAAKFLGIKVTAVAYYIDSNDNVVYSENNVDGYIQGGVADKAILNVAIDAANANQIAIPDLDTVETMVANRDALLKAVVEAKK